MEICFHISFSFSWRPRFPRLILPSPRAPCLLGIRTHLAASPNPVPDGAVCTPIRLLRYALASTRLWLLLRRTGFISSLKIDWLDLILKKTKTGKTEQKTKIQTGLSFCIQNFNLKNGRSINQKNRMINQKSLGFWFFSKFEI
jgi:hypothetical protein